MKKGVMVGCDKEQEWLLIWWWKHYHKHNRHPVAFVDFGMTQEAKRWCAHKGEVISLERSKDFMMPESLINKNLVADWEMRFGPISWSSRKQRFLKPFAMLQTPFDQTIWSDLDCEITGSISPLFQKIHSHSGIAIGCEKKSSSEDVRYNSGVIAFNRDGYLVEKWAQACLQCNDRFFSDQDVLGFLIQHEDIEISEIASKYNWCLNAGVNIEAIIIHWNGLWGKEVLRREINKHHSIRLF
jgi:hypothetical protein